MRPPSLQIPDDRGAGDPMTAGVAPARGDDLDGARRIVAAAGALDVNRHGLGSGNAEAIAELIKRVRVEPA